MVFCNKPKKQNELESVKSNGIYFLSETQIHTRFSPLKNDSESCAAEGAGGVGGLLLVTPAKARIIAKTPGTANIDNYKYSANSVLMIKYLKDDSLNRPSR